MSDEAAPGFGDSPQPQADSPAQDIQPATSPASEITLGGEQASETGGWKGARRGSSEEIAHDQFIKGSISEGEQELDSKGVRKAVGQPEQGGEKGMESRESTDGQKLAGEPMGEDESEQAGGEDSLQGGEKDEGECEDRDEGKAIIKVRKRRSAREREGEHPSHQGVSEDKKRGEKSAQVILLSAAHRKCLSPVDMPMQDEKSGQWLKSILPEASNGWWDVRAKPNRSVIMFRWLDPEQRAMTLLRLTNDQIQGLKLTGREDDAKGRIRELIATNLRQYSLDSANRIKARIVAEKLGIDLAPSVNNVNILISNEM